MEEFKQALGLIEKPYFTEIIKDRNEHWYFLQLPLKDIGSSGHETKGVRDVGEFFF